MIVLECTNEKIDHKHHKLINYFSFSYFFHTLDIREEDKQLTRELLSASFFYPFQSFELNSFPSVVGISIMTMVRINGYIFLGCPFVYIRISDVDDWNKRGCSFGLFA